MKAIRALDNRSIGETPWWTFDWNTPRNFAKFRREIKIFERGGPLSKGKTVVYTRDVSNGTDIGVVPIGVKRHSLNATKHHLTVLQERGARPRQLKRAQDKLEKRIRVEQDRKDRENNGSV